MCAYLIVLAELAIFYTVFWYVFLREPNPYKVSGDSWGAYGEDHRRDLSDADCPPTTSDERSSKRLEWSNVNESAYRTYCEQQFLHGENSLQQDESSDYNLPAIQRNPTIKYDWVYGSTSALHPFSSVPFWQIFARKWRALIEHSAGF